MFLIQREDSKEMLLRIENLHVTFETFHGVVHALSGVNLNLHEGKITGLVGETGSGKSVTAKSVMGLITKPGKIISGKIYLENEDLLIKSESKMQDIRGKIISMIFQNPRSALNPLFNVEDQMFFILKRHQNLNKRESRKKTIELLDSVGIADPERRLENYPFEMSTGMCQRIMIAMALSCQPKLLIADEPTTGLDVTIQAQILDLFNQMVSDFGSTALIITHDLGVVAETCDYTAVMYASQIVEFGPTQNVFNRPLHPYTQGLLASSFYSENSESFYYIPGRVPNLINFPSGCQFAERCEASRQICFEKNPPMESLYENHQAKCFAASSFSKGKNWSNYKTDSVIN